MCVVVCLCAVCMCVYVCMYVCIHVVCVCPYVMYVSVCVYTCCMCVSLCLYVSVCVSMCICIQILLAYAQTHASTYHGPCMLLYTFKPLVNSAYAKKNTIQHMQKNPQSPTPSLGNKHPLPNIFCKMFSPQIFLTYPQIHASTCPTLSLGSKHPFPNIFCKKKDSPQILLTYPQTHASTYHRPCIHFCTLLKLLSILHSCKKVPRE